MEWKIILKITLRSIYTVSTGLCKTWWLLFFYSNIIWKCALVEARKSNLLFIESWGFITNFELQKFYLFQWLKKVLVKNQNLFSVCLFVWMSHSSGGVSVLFSSLDASWWSGYQFSYCRHSRHLWLWLESSQWHSGSKTTWCTWHKCIIQATQAPTHIYAA